MVAAIEHTWSTGGYQRIDLGVGTQHFKFQIADGAEQVEWNVQSGRGGVRFTHRPSLFRGRSEGASATWRGPSEHDRHTPRGGSRCPAGPVNLDAKAIVGLRFRQLPDPALLYAGKPD
jgi:hypothetical protein